MSIDLRRLAAVAGTSAVVLAVFVPVHASSMSSVRTVQHCTESALRSAIANAPDGGTVKFGCNGTITLTAAGGNTIETHKTLTVDGSGHQVTISGGGETSLFFVSSADSGIKTFTAKHLTLSDGYSADGALIAGSAVYNANAHFVADDVTFRDNHAFNYGGALYNVGSYASASITDSRFIDNVVTCDQTGQGGGAIASNAGGATTVTGSDFSGNYSVGGASGGAILANRTYNSALAGPISISGSTFENNAINVDEPNYYGLPFGGGAVGVYNHPLTISGSTFTANHATTDFGAGFGGAVLAWGDPDPNSPLPLQPVSISGTTFSGNLSEHNNDYGFGVAGALALLGPPATITNSRFHSNAAAQAGAIFNASDLKLTGSTLTGNHASGYDQSPPIAGGLVNDDTLIVSRTRFADNSDVNCALVQGFVIDTGGNSQSPDQTCLPITSANRATFTTGRPNSFTVTTVGTPTRAISESGHLPAGVVLHDNGDGTAVLSGTPTRSAVGTYRFALIAANGAQSTGTQQFTLRVTARG